MEVEANMPSEKKNLLIINPNAGKGMGYRMASQVESVFNQRGWPFATSFTFGVKHAVQIARDAVSKGFETVVAVGGDGTINEVANGIANAKNVKLGIVSIGTGNDYIKAVGIPSDIEEAVDVIVKGKTRFVDLGKVEDMYFINGLGCGFDAQVSEDLYKIKRLKGFPAYLYVVCKNLFFFNNPLIEMTFDKQVIKHKSMMISVMIGNCLGGGFHLTPSAQVDDGLFDVLNIGHFRLLKRFLHLPKVIKGTHLKVKGVECYRTKEITISSDADVKVHIDGEMMNVNTKHFTVKIYKQALQLIVP